MEVILTRDVEKLGLKGEVVDVKRGYARNYLLPVASPRSRPPAGSPRSAGSTRNAHATRLARPTRPRRSRRR